MNTASAFFLAVRPAERSLARVLGIVVAGCALTLVTGAAGLQLSRFLETWAVWADLKGATREATWSWVQSNLRELAWRPSLSFHLFDFVFVSVLIAGAGLGFWLAARWLHRRPLLTFLTSAPRFRWRLLLVGFVLAAVAATALIAVAHLAIAREPPAPLLRPGPALDRVLFAFGILALMPLAAFGEEVVFRGWMMQQTAAFTRNLFVVICLNSLVFSALHLSFDVLPLAARVISGVALAWSVVRLGGLELAIGAHAGKNAAIYWWWALPGDGSGPFGGAAFLMHVAISATVILCSEVLARRGSQGAPPVPHLPSSI